MEASEAFKQQRVAMFDHLLFEERFFTTLKPAHWRSTAQDAAAAFWQHDESAEALISPEINPLIWSDFRSGSGLQQAARYWLVQKLFHGRCLLEAINMDGGIPLETMKQRCSSSFDPDFYWTQRAEWGIPKEVALDHYLEYGWNEGLSPNSTFDNEAALQQNPLLRNVGMNPLYFAICTGDSDVQQRLLKETISRFVMAQLWHNTVKANPASHICGSSSKAPISTLDLLGSPLPPRVIKAPLICIG